MTAYQLARQLRETAWDDAEEVRQHPITENIAAQLYEAIGSIPVNIAEGYSRSSGKDRARIFEYALGSARETREWYESVERILDPETLLERIKLVDEIKVMLLAIIPRERTRLIRPAK
jgi:four helix bundle protein